jgi:predicted MFS family arabinose efflux permease
MADGRMRVYLHFALIFGSHALGAMSLLSVLAASPALIAALGLSAVQIGALASLYSGALALAALPAGLVVDRIGTWTALVLASLVISFGLAICAMASGFVHLAVGLTLCGAGYGLINPAASRAILCWFSPEWRTSLLSLKQTGVPLGAALGSASVMLSSFGGWQTGIWAAAILTLVVSMMFAVFLPKDRQTPGASTGGLRQIGTLLRDPVLGRANLAAALTNGMQFALWAHLPEIIQRAQTGGMGSVTACLGALHVGTFAGRLVWGVLTDRWLGGNPAIGLQAICALALAGVSIFAAGVTWDSLALSATGCFLLGGTVSSAVGLHIALTTCLVPRKDVGGAVGYTMLLTNLGGVVVPILLGLALSYAGGAGALAALATLILGTILCLRRINPRHLCD